MLAFSVLACTASPPDVLLVTLDTTRADAIGAWGRSPSPSPNLDALAARGVRFDEALSVTPLTLPAHATLLTGRLPDAHGLRDNLSGALDPAVETLAERLSAAGWRTGAFVGAVVLDSTFGLDQGFDAYDDGFDLTAGATPGDAIVQWPADAVASRAETWLGSQPGNAPAFVWMHLYDPHHPLTAPERFRRFDDDYLAEVAYVDEALGRLVSDFEERGRPLIVVVSGDHGEGRGDHGETQHGQFVYRSTMRVPLVVAGPGIEPAVVAEPRSIVDVTPTILALAGLPAGGFDGASLLGPPAALVYGESFHPRLQYGYSELRVIEDGQWRYILAPRPELYDWRNDGGETRDLAADRPAEAERLRTTLEAWLATRPSAKAAPAGEPMREALARLGYVEGSAPIAADVAFSDLPDPKDHPDIEQRFGEVIVAARTRPPADAVPLIEAFLAENPGVGGARQLLSVALERGGRPVEAREAIAPLLEAHPGDPALGTREAELLLAEGRTDEAVAAVQRVLGDRPDFPAAVALRAEIARRAGDCATALKLVEDGLARHPEASKLLLVRGACRLSQDDLAGAATDLEAVVATTGDPDASFLLGVVEARQGRVDEAILRLEAQVARTPGQPLAEAALGMALYAGGRYAEAIPHLSASAASEPVGDEPPLLLADAILRTAGDLAEADRWLVIAEARAADDRPVWRVRSAVRMARGDVEGAVADMKRAGE